MSAAFKSLLGAVGVGGIDKNAGDDDEQVQWCSVDPRNNSVVPYDEISMQELESAWRNNRAQVELRLGGNMFVVKLSDMRQYNMSGGSRKVVRKSGRPPPVELPVVDLQAEAMAAAMKTVENADAAVRKLEKNETSRGASVTTRAFGDVAPVIHVFDSILASFTQARYRSKYGFSDDDANLLRIQFGDPVPAYFANVQGGQSIFHRKYLSLLGLRNLVKYGPEIFLEMRKNLFSGCIADYKAKTGPHKMKYFTGNVVDLDTCVLRCHEEVTINAVNQMQKAQNQPTFSNAEELGRSEVGRRMAVEQAKTLIDAFKQRFKLNADETRRRRIDLNPDNLQLPVATTNDDRSKCPVWIYRNMNVLTFHANVPTMSDVYGALLLAPYHLAKAFILIQRQSKNADELQANLDAFFEDGVSDSCFNAKWKAIEMFVQEREERGVIDDVLNRLQQANQADFLALEDDDDGQKELQLMQRLAVGVSGVDPKTKTVRSITPADVAAWHAKIMAAAGM